MAKSETAFVCKNCGYESPKWLGKCPACGEWNSFKEITTVLKGPAKGRRPISTQTTPLALDKINAQTGQRISSGISEADRILGGGLVTGQVILISGEPGVGKSTLLLQLAQNFNAKIFYVSGEESLGQIKARAERLGINDKKISEIFLSNETRVEEIVGQAEELKAHLLIVDSIQTVTTDWVESGAGSLSQVRESAAQIIAFAKEKNTPVFLVGHITKEGVVAGPKILEHMVDTVLELTGERFLNLRLLRVTKNRFGPVDELAVFGMGNQGLREVKNPSELFLAEVSSDSPGSCITVLMEGTRPILVEIQALAVASPLPIPRRLGSGIDHSRVSLLGAILQKRAGLRLFNQDIYVKVAGGLRIKEPAADLAAALAIASSFKNKPLGKMVAIGEIGLIGEIRKVSRMETRLKEAKRLGFKTIISAENYKSLKEVLKKLT